MGNRLRLLLVRHGEVAANRELRYIGRRNESLTPLGVEQAECLGRSLAQLPLRRILTSPLERTRATAACIAARSGLELEPDERLLEQSFGDWEGMSRTELLAEARGRDWLRRFEHDVTVAPPGGESLLAVQERVTGLVNELAKSGEDWVVLVSHVGPIKALLARALDLSLQQVRRFFLDPATLTVIDWREPPLLRLFNGHGHLGWTRALWMGDEVRPSAPGGSHQEAERDHE